MKKDVTPRDGRSRKRTAITAAIITGGAAITGGVAYANWNAAGTGNGSARAVMAQNLVITADAAPTADLYPGFVGGLKFTVNNPNPYPVSLTNYTTGAITTSDPTGCPAAGNVTVPASGTISTPIAVAANTTTAVQTIPGTITMTGTAANACQGVLFTVVLTLSGTQT